MTKLLDYRLLEGRSENN